MFILLPENLRAVPRSFRMVTTSIKGWPAGERGVRKMTQIVCVLTNEIKQKKKVRKWACNATTTTVSFICMTITIHNCKSVESMIMTVIQLSRYNCNKNERVISICLSFQSTTRWTQLTEGLHRDHLNSLIVISNFYAIIFEYHQFLFQFWKGISL